jgi:LCP family protein required for cell wall assembly
MKLSLRKEKKIDPTKLDPIENDSKETVVTRSVAKPPHKGRFWRFISKFFAVAIPVLLFAGAIPYAITIGSPLVQKFFKATNFTITGNSSAFSTLKKEPELLKESNGLTNVLIVGIDTRAKGSKLLNTDTIILAMYNHNYNEVAMISFPRDLNVNYPGTPSYGKINATYAYGEMRKSGSGIEYLKQLIESITGRKIHYHVMVDLKGFTTIVDQLGGVDVYVDTAFSGDYPTEKLGWITVNFKKGNNHMNGTRALQYARIRYAYPGSEASDFARARRQQKVIQAVIDKAVKNETLQNTKKVFEIMGTVASNIKINRVTPEDVQAGLNILLTKGKPASYSMVLDPGAGGYGRLIKRGSGYLYTLEPTAGRNNWSQIKSFVKDYAAAPGLVTIKKPIYVYNGGATDFNAKVNSLNSRYYYADFINGGAPKGLPVKGVYNIGGTAYISTAKFLASVNKVPYFEVTETTVVPKPKNCPIVIVLGK